MIPVAITGTAEEVFEAHFPKKIHSSNVTIEFGAPFYRKGAGAGAKFAGAYTRERILEMLQRERNNDQEERE